MLNQAELNFYGYNTKNIIKRQSRGRVLCVVYYDAKNKLYIIQRKTPRTALTARAEDAREATSLFCDYLYSTAREINKKGIVGEWFYY